MVVSVPRGAPLLEGLHRDDGRRLPRDAHAALRLTCNHEGYAPLWREQLGDRWREPTPPFTWPVLGPDDARWALRAAIDAVVASAYGLTRDQYAHVLSTFSHKSYPAAPALCLAAFDDLARTGLDAFVRANDPYWDVPLVETLPRPVVDLLAPQPEGGAASPAPAPTVDRHGQVALLLDSGPMFGVAPAIAAPPPPPPPPPPAPPAPTPPSQDAAYAALLRLLDDRGLIASRDAQETTGLDAAGVRPLLKRLVDEGKAAVEGERRGTRYRRKEGA